MTSQTTARPTNGGLPVEDDDFPISVLATRAGVSVETVRFYERLGVLDRAPRTSSGYRRYGRQHVQRMSFVKRAKDLGFTLTEIGEMVKAGALGSVESVTTAAHAKLTQLNDEIAALSDRRCRLQQLLRICDHGDGANCLALNSLPGNVYLSSEQPEENP